MRNGRLLEEGEPNALMAKYQTSTVEQVFLMLCSCQDGLTQETPFDDNRNINNQDPELGDKGDLTEDMILKQTKLDDTFSQSPNYTSTPGDRTKALVVKNILRVVRHPG